MLLRHFSFEPIRNVTNIGYRGRSKKDGSMKFAPFPARQFFQKYGSATKLQFSNVEMANFTAYDLLTFVKEDVETLLIFPLSYQHPKGAPAFREALAEHYSKDILPDDHITTFVGAREALFATLHALIEPDDHVICFTPCYHPLLAIPEMLTNHISNISLETPTGFALPLEEIKKAITNRTKVIICNFPHNPTGTVPTKEEFNELISLADQHGTYLLVDEIFRFLELGRDPLPPIALSYEKGISISGLSKAYGLPGLRLGWTIARDPKLIHRITEIKQYTSVCNSPLSEKLAIYALTHHDTIQQIIRPLLDKKLLLIKDFFYRHKDIFSFCPPQAGPMLYPRLIHEKDAEHFTIAMAKEAGVLAYPSSCFHHKGPYFRCSLSSEPLEKILSTLDDWIYCS